MLLGLISSGLLLLHSPTLQTAFLLAVTIWSCCRAYYFAFYVIQHYVDPKFRFSGLIDFVRYALFGNSPDRQDGAE